jgi:hypothetical protein
MGGLTKVHSNKESEMMGVHASTKQEKANTMLLRSPISKKLGFHVIYMKDKKICSRGFLHF